MAIRIPVHIDGVEEGTVFVEVKDISYRGLVKLQQATAQRMDKVWAGIEKLFKTVDNQGLKRAKPDLYAQKEAALATEMSEFETLWDKWVMLDDIVKPSERTLEIYGRLIEFLLSEDIEENYSWPPRS